MSPAEVAYRATLVPDKEYIEALNALLCIEAMLRRDASVRPANKMSASTADILGKKCSEARRRFEALNARRNERVSAAYDAWRAEAR